MKKHTIHNLLLRPLALLCCTALLASCYSDDELDSRFPAAPEGGKATVRIGVTAERSDEPLTRATEEGKAHEHMNHLHVLIVNADGSLALDLLPDLSRDADALTGDMERWTSDPIELAPGTYTLYAVANWKGYDNATLNALSTSIESSTGFSSWLESLRTLQLENPAGRVKIDDVSVRDGSAVFIPMSGMEVANVTASTTMLEIPLDRLVSKVRTTIDLTHAEHGLADGAQLFFSGVCPVVGLFDPVKSMGDITLSGDWNTLNYKRPVAAQTVGSSVAIPDFYVNETMLSRSFTVTLETGNDFGVQSYTATTSRTKELPRNSILPLTLDLSGWKLGLEVQAWKSPIDEYPLPLTVNQVSSDTYNVRGLCEGGQFRLSISSITSTEDSRTGTVANVVWTIPGKPWGIHFDGNTYTAEESAVKGAISGDDRLVGKDFTVEAQVTWTDGGDTYNRTYCIILNNLLDITDAETVDGRRSICSLTRSLLEPCWLQPETLILFTKK